ncbi:MAG: nitrilase-related carbon-nitrogen hydrolase, partial [Gemmatimonadaceae bacterium]
MPRTLSIALAQLHPRKGDYAANLARIGDVFTQLLALDSPPQLLHLPETVLSGYFVEGGVGEVAVTAGTLAADLDRVYQTALGGRAAPPLDVIAGFYERWRGTLYNAAAYVRLGDGDARILHVHRKAFLPTYGLFDEERFVERGHEIRAFDTPWGRAAILICEDAWHSLSGTIAALDDAEVIFVSAAAPARGIHPRDDGTATPATVARWERLVREIAEEHGVFVSLSNLVGSEGGKVFAGCSSVIGPRGERRVRGPAWEEALLTLTLDLGDIGRARADTPLLADLRTALPHLRRSLDRSESGGSDRAQTPFDARVEHEQWAEVIESGSEGDEVRGGSGASGASEAKAARVTGGASAARERGAPPKRQNTSPAAHDHHPSIALRIISAQSSAQDTMADSEGPPPLAIDAAMVESWLLRFLRDELERRRLRQVVVGVSGGVDSAVTAFLAARALGKENVLAVRLP